jgi:hypothetical protein
MVFILPIAADRNPIEETEFRVKIEFHGLPRAVGLFSNYPDTYELDHLLPI